jgi:hypothetical protein
LAAEQQKKSSLRPSRLCGERLSFLPHELQAGPIILVVGLYPFDFRKDRQRDVHGLGREIDPDHFLGLQGDIRFDPDPQGADIDGPTDLQSNGILSGEKPASLELNGLVEDFAGGKAVVIFGLHRVSFQGYSPQRVTKNL